VKAVNFDVYKNTPKLIGYQSNIHWATAKLVSFIMLIHVSTNSENTVEIVIVVAEIFGEICRFLPSHLKKGQLLPL